MEEQNSNRDLLLSLKEIERQFEKVRKRSSNEEEKAFSEPEARTLGRVSLFGPYNKSRMN